MACVMMIGYGPLPAPGLKLFMAPSLRTRHLLHGALEGNHDVHLYTLPLPGTEGKEAEIWDLIEDTYEGRPIKRFTNHSGEFAVQRLNEEVQKIHPDAIVGVNTYPSYVGSMIATTAPMWADLNGYWMAEMQARCHAEKDDARLVSAWSIERAILRRADKFSAVSRPQLHAVLGEMATLGRLNRYTFDYPFGTHIPNAAHRWPEPENDGAGPILRGPVVPEDAFIILWSGGFNLWTDIEMLIKAMAELMEQHPRVHFVSTGGQLEGIDTKTYAEFEAAIDASPHRDRFHRLGWVESEKLPRIYREADVGINIDGQNYETFFGARNRINAMAAEGLAICSTLGTEISEWLHDGEALAAARMGDPQSLVEAIEPWIEQPEQLELFSERARKIMETDFSYSATTRALREWLEEPKLAPDNEEKVRASGGELADMNAGANLNDLMGQAAIFDAYDARTFMQTARELESIRKKLWYRAYKKLQKIFGA